MKRFVKFSTLATAALIMLNGSALANDYNSGIVSKTPSEGFTEVEYGSGWYLRGDITYNIDGRSESGLNAVSSVSSSIQVDYDDAVGARIGVGYYAAPNFRLEANLESLFDTEIAGLGGQTFNAVNTLTGAPTLTGGSREIEADYNGFTLMASGNFDLGTYGAFTPYVGAGAGIGRIEYNQTETLICTPSSPDIACTSFPAGAAGEQTESTRVLEEASWTYAYQLSLGTAIAVSDKTSIDLSYSYTQIGDGDSLSYADGTALDEDGVRLHQIRAGLRYEIW